MSNIHQFSLKLDRFVNETIPDELLKLKRQIAFLVLEGVVLKSPVDTGFFRAQWTVQIGTAANGTIQSFDPAGNLTITKGLAVIHAVKAGQNITISNAAVYGPRLEHGWSKQAPQGMVRLTLAEIKARFRVAA